MRRRAPTPADSVPTWRRFAPGVLLALAIFAVYARSLRGEFLWDDDIHITANPTIIGPLGLKEIWTTASAYYFPLVLTNFWVQHALWGLEPAGFRLVTLVFHIASALLLWRVLRQLFVPGSPRRSEGETGAWLGAALWALHPVQVESAAWICELKNTQSAVFFLLAILFWLKWLAAEPIRSRHHYALSLGCALLAILSKPSTVMLPLALALCAWWTRRRFNVRDLVPLLPFFALSALAAGWTIWEQKVHSGATGPEWEQSLPERIVIAGRVIWFYLGKLVWPEPLIFIYPRWSIEVGSVASYLPLAAALIGLIGLWWRRGEGAWRPVFFAAAFFVALLFPVLGFFNVYFFRYSFVGDHFQYLASIGPLALLGAGLARLARRWRSLLAAALLVPLGVFTAVQTRVYRNTETLWRHTVALNPAATMAWMNLGDTLARAQRHEEAIATYRRALQNRPDDPHGLNDLGCELVLVGRAAEAVPHFEHALRVKPDYAEPHNNLGNALRDLGRVEEALAHYRRAVELKPDYVEARNNLAAELADSGRAEEAVTLLLAAIARKPDHAPSHDHLASALRALGRFDEALARHAEALRLNPQSAEAHANLGRTLLTADRAAESLPHFRRAIELKPTLVSAYGHLARALAASGRHDEALAHYEQAAKVVPHSAEARNNLGTALVARGRLAEALAHFEAAVQHAPRFAPARDNLGNAFAQAGRWREAAAQFEAAAQLQPDSAAAQAKLAVALVNSERLADAVPAFEHALRLDPTAAEVHDNFAQLLRALGRNREASQHFERAAELRRAPRRE